MKKIFALSGLVFEAALCFSGAYGQTSLDLEFRPRTEFREGFRKPLADTLKPGFVTLQRTRFNADYKSKILNTHISLEDSRIWGNTDIKSNSTKVAIYEAWFEYLIASGLSVQTGRQPLKYDDQRLLAAPNWSNAGIVHDVLVLKYNSSFIQVHSGFAYNNAKDTLLNVAYNYTPKQNYKTMGYAWLSKHINTTTTLTLIGICEGFESKTNYKTVYPRITYGVNIIHANDSSVWGATLTAYMQSGKDPNRAFGKGYADLKSYFLAVKASYKIMKKLSANVGIDYYSGSNAASLEVGKSNTFNRLYGAVHNFNGYMEYFSTLPAQGLMDYSSGITTKITPKLSVELTWHMFYFDKEFIYKNEVAEKNLGTEADIIANYVVSKEITIQGGYCRYFNSGTTAKYFRMQDIDVHPQHWAYLMLTLRPQLYKTPPMPESK